MTAVTDDDSKKEEVKKDSSSPEAPLPDADDGATKTTAAGVGTTTTNDSSSTSTSNKPTNPDTGLTDDEVLKAREIYGVNEIPAPETPLYVIFLRQFVGFLPLLIEIAMIVALAVQDWIDFGIIAGTIL